MEANSDTSPKSSAPGSGISLVMCVRDFRPAMEKFFERLNVAELVEQRAQLVFVDLDSHDGTQEVIEAFQQTSQVPVELLYDAQICISRARNLALEKVTGDLVAFLDDPDAFSGALLRSGGEAFADDLIDYALLGSQPPTSLPPNGFVPASACYGAALFARRKMVEALGGFDVSYHSDRDFDAENLAFTLHGSLSGHAGAVIQVAGSKLAAPEPAADAAYLQSAGAVYLSHFWNPRPGADRYWLREWAKKEGASRRTEIKGALRSIWHSEPVQHHVRRPLFRVRNPREFQAYGIGTSKSGTHTLRSLTIGNFWSEHEPEDRELIEHIVAYETGRCPRSKMLDYVQRRDSRLYLEMDASNLNIHLVDLILELFPRARFILTVRDCLGWVDSEINHRLGRPFPRAWKKMWDHRYQAERFTHAPEEQALAERGLHTLDGYFSYWNWHNATAIKNIPADQVLIIKTKDLSHATEQIADFLAIPLAKLDTRFHHAFAASKKFGVLRQLDPEYVAAKAEMHCGETMRRLFPELPLSPTASAKL